MTSLRTTASIAGLTALAATLFTAAPTHAQTVTVTDLNQTGANDLTTASRAFGVSGTHQVGDISSRSKALLWTGTPGSAAGLNPKNTNFSIAYGVSGNRQVGSGSGFGDNGYYVHALVWKGTPAGAVNLDPVGFEFSEAYGASGETQVGVASNGRDLTGGHAFLWSGTAASAVDLHPAGATQSTARGVSGDAQVGYGNVDDPTYGTAYPHALLWHGTAGSVIDLNPTGSVLSEAYGVSGDTQVGCAAIKTPTLGNPMQAVLWHGTADSFINLNPDGFNSSMAYGASGSVQVGYGYDPSIFAEHALLWTGSAASVLDLNKYLPAQYTGGSRAYGVDSSGNVVNVVGTADQIDSNNFHVTHAILWHIVFPSKATILHLDPASRTAGRDGFPLSVSGSGFTASSVITWNGAAQPTTFVSPYELTTNIPASLIATAGTASVAVSTSGTISNVRTETINPRPVLSSLSPTSKAAGSAAFTLTVSGTGFLRNTVVKWNGTAQTTHYVSSTTLTAQIAASLVKTARTVKVTVTTPGVATSDDAAFTVTP